MRLARSESPHERHTHVRAYDRESVITSLARGAPTICDACAHAMICRTFFDPMLQKSALWQIIERLAERRDRFSLQLPT